MPEIQETLISYHRGAVEGQGRIVRSQRYESGGPSSWAVITDTTPFHPVDLAWPDQPADQGTIVIGSMVLPVVDTQILTLESATGQVRIGPAVTARRHDPGYVFAVAHLVDSGSSSLDGIEQQAVQLQVDVARRRALSAAHTGCHLVAFAFNEVTDHLWGKETARNSRGHRDFDAAALIDTRHHTGGSVDRYRLGKSLRKKGFPHAELINELDSYVAATNQKLAEWVAGRAKVDLTAKTDRFTAERRWRCRLPVAPASMPCGGTHVAHLGEIDSIEIEAEYSVEAGELALKARTKTV